jgi:hypothetical protein
MYSLHDMANNEKAKEILMRRDPNMTIVNVNTRLDVVGVTVVVRLVGVAVAP